MATVVCWLPLGAVTGPLGASNKGAPKEREAEGVTLAVREVEEVTEWVGVAEAEAAVDAEAATEPEAVPLALRDTLPEGAAALVAETVALGVALAADLVAVGLTETVDVVVTATEAPADRDAVAEATTLAPPERVGLAVPAETEPVAETDTAPSECVGDGDTVTESVGEGEEPTERVALAVAFAVCARAPPASAAASTARRSSDDDGDMAKAAAKGRDLVETVHTPTGCTV